MKQNMGRDYRGINRRNKAGFERVTKDLKPIL